MMNYQEILEAVKKQILLGGEDFEEGEEYDLDDADVSMFAYQDFVNPLPGVGAWKVVDKEGGEGQGEEWYVVFHFTEHDVYIRVDGFYTSHNGTDFDQAWDSCSEVRPKEKTITVYEKN